MLKRKNRPFTNSAEASRAWKKVKGSRNVAGGLVAIPRPLLRVGGRMPAGNHELKNIDVIGSTITVASSSGLISLINGVAQGTTATTRLGRRIQMKSLFIRAEIRMAPTTAGASPIRYLVIYDKQTNGTAPAATDVLTTDALYSPMNLSNSRRFVVIFDKVWPCLGTAGPQSITVEKYIKLNLPVEFNTGSAGTVGDIQTGSLYTLLYQDAGLITLAPPGAFYTRVRFSDQ